MDSLDAADRLAALGHETRLGIFRLLVQAGPAGIVAGGIGERMALPPATLSFHLAHLARVGLVDSERESRFIRYRVNFDVMDNLIAYLTDNCCQGGGSCLPKTAAVSTQAKRRKKDQAE